MEGPIIQQGKHVAQKTDFRTEILFSLSKNLV